MAVSVISMVRAPVFLCNNAFPASMRRSFETADSRYVRILDTTLRDGEQSPGVSLSVNEKLDIARQLALLRVDAIEAGYPITSPNEFQAAKLIAKEVGNPQETEREHDGDTHIPIICAFARCKKADIDAAWEGVKPAAKPSILTLIATSDIHLEHKLHMSRGNAVRLAVEMVRYIKSLGCNDIIFAAEDAGRLLPLVPGKLQLDVTINGIGERAGNAALEEVVMAIKSRGQYEMDGLHTGIRTKHIIATSKMVADYTGMQVQPHKAIVGAHAFAHESGIHQDGMLKYPKTYEFLSPEDVGLHRTNRGIVLGKHSLAIMLRVSFLIDCLYSSRPRQTIRNTYRTQSWNLWCSA